MRSSESSNRNFGFMMKQRKYRAKEFEDGNDDDLDTISNHGMSQKNASGIYGTLTDPGS